MIHNEGPRSQRGAGRWAIVLDCDPGEDGKRKQKWVSFAGTKRQAQIRCAELIAELQNGGGIDPARVTVAAFLERWLEHMKGQVSPKSHERYAEIARKNLAPLLGRLVLAKLQPTHISSAYAQGPHLRSQRRAGTMDANRDPHAPRVTRSSPAGRALAIAGPKSSRRRQATPGRTAADVGAGRWRDG